MDKRSKFTKEEIDDTYSKEEFDKIIDDISK